MGGRIRQRLRGPRRPRSALHGLQNRHDRGQRRIDHERRGDAGPPRREGVADDQAGARRHARHRAALAGETAALISKWVEEGSSQFGLHRASAHGAAAMDAVWTPIAEAVLAPTLGSLIPEFESINGTDNPPNSSGSSFGGGWYGYVYKDLRTLLGDPVEGAYSRSYCGSGSLDGLQPVAVGGDPESGRRRRRDAGEQSRQMACAGREDPVPPGPAPVHDALDQPLHLPAGHRIHRARRIGMPAPAPASRRGGRTARPAARPR